MNREHWKVRTYEVWGGEWDDPDAEWHVNNIWDGGTIELPEDPLDEEVLKAVAEHVGYKPVIRLLMTVDAASDEDHIYIGLENGYPLCEVIRDQG